MIECADRETGKVRTFEIDADSRTEADTLAAMLAQHNNLLIASVEPIRGTVTLGDLPQIESATQPSEFDAMIAECDAAVPRGAPRYLPLIKAAKLVVNVGTALLILGVVGVGVGLIWLKIAIDSQTIPIPSSEFLPKPTRYRVEVPEGIIIQGFWCVVVGAVLRLTAGCAIVLRDIARNSFRG
jgi:hypothetical protein